MTLRPSPATTSAPCNHLRNWATRFGRSQALVIVFSPVEHGFSWFCCSPGPQAWNDKWVDLWGPFVSRPPSCFVNMILLFQQAG